MEARAYARYVVAATEHDSSLAFHVIDSDGTCYARYVVAATEHDSALAFHVTKIALADFAWHFIVGKPWDSTTRIAKKFVLGPRAGFIYIYIYIKIYKLYS